MKKGLFARKGVFAAVCLAVTLSACGGGGGGSNGGGSGTAGTGTTGTTSGSGTSGATAGTNPGATSPVSPASTANLPPPAAQLITQRYSAAPELQVAAVGFANALLARWESARTTKAYDGNLVSTSVNALSCLIARSERLGKPMSELDVRNFLAAMASTPELLRAYIAADKLVSGHPQKIATGEAQACALGGIQ